MKNALGSISTGHVLQNALKNEDEAYTHFLIVATDLVLMVGILFDPLFFYTVGSKRMDYLKQIREWARPTGPCFCGIFLQDCPTPMEATYR